MILKNYQEFLERKKILINNLKGKFGCVVEFEGFVREYDLKGREKVPAKGLDIKETIIEKLKEIREEAIRKYEIIEVLIYHATGFLKVGERISVVAVFARHREPAFSALAFIIEEMKKYH